MSDDEWDVDEFVPTPIVAASKTKGELLLEKLKQPDHAKFAGEDSGEEDDPAWKKNIPESQQVRLHPSRI
jgi:hypothetical protein